MQEIKTVKIEDTDYPAELKKIKDPPKVIYYIGTLPTEKERCIAIVGTRRYSPYGQQTTLKISGELADSGATIVSGLAPGIDTFAHRAVIEKGERTIAVLGTGLDEKSVYPQTNLDLSRKIVEFGGCLISELPPGSSGSKFSFPRRNRIVSGISEAVLVIEAKEKSGSLITANFATKQGKKLFAVPGPIYSQNSMGPNKLIRDGARIIIDHSDIIRELGLNRSESKEYIITAENDQENMVIEALKNEPLNVDKIIEITKLNAPLVSTTLALMEISGKIRCLKGNIYSLNI